MAFLYGWLDIKHSLTCLFAWLYFGWNSDYSAGLNEPNISNLEKYNVLRFITTFIITIKKKSKQARTSRSIISMSLQMKRDYLDTLTSTIKFKSPSLPWSWHESQGKHLHPGQSFSSLPSQPRLLDLETKLLHLFILRNQTYRWTLPPSFSYAQAAIPYRC